MEEQVSAVGGVHFNEVAFANVEMHAACCISWLWFGGGGWLFG